jgi:hypothetical protein
VTGVTSASIAAWIAGKTGWIDATIAGTCASSVASIGVKQRRTVAENDV